MVSNLRSAQQAIKAELDQAKKGVAFYSSRIAALESVLEKLDSVDGAGESATKKRVTTHSNDKASKATGAKRAPKRKAAVRVNGKNGSTLLPKTGGEFWLKLVTEDQQSAVDVASAAAKSLGLDPMTDRKRILVLKQRATPGLNGLVSAQKIQDSGTGRERRFFKA
jgi:hypothetical protein